VTRLGKLLDPAADKILTSAAFISLVEMNPAVTPAWMVAVIIAREFAVSSLRGFAASDSLVLAASPAAKLKTTMQIIAISLLIFYNQLGQFGRLAPICLWAAMLVSLYSGAEYFVRHGRQLLLRAGRGAG